MHLNLLTPKEYIFLTKSLREYIFSNFINMMHSCKSND